MSADAPRPVRPGDHAVVHGPLVAVESVHGDFAEVTAGWMSAEIPVAWLVPIYDRRGGEG